MPNLELGVYTLKKLLIVLTVLLILLSACAAAQPPVQTEIPATERPATESPAVIENSLPEVTRINFDFQYNYVPKNWVQNYKESETISFYPRGEEWGTSALSPVFVYHGPLFPIEVDGFENKNGNCEINAIVKTLENMDQTISAKPLCRVPSSEEIAFAIVRLPNCDRDVYLNLTCTFNGQFEILQYTLNAKQDRFTYQHSGDWDLSFEGAMNTSLTILGFEPPSAEFLQSTIPGKTYTITK
jgi:hypothetical protein